MSRCHCPTRGGRSKPAANQSTSDCASIFSATWSRKSSPAGRTYREGLDRIPRFARAGRDSARPAAFDLAAFGDLLVHVADLAHSHTYLEACFENIADGTIPGHLIATLWRQMLGYGLAVVIGITLGLAMGYYRLLYNLFEPLVEVLRPIPGPAYLP